MLHRSLFYFILIMSIFSALLVGLLVSFTQYGGFKTSIVLTYTVVMIPCYLIIGYFLYRTSKKYENPE